MSESISNNCPSYPGYKEEPHECCRAEMICAYCSVRLDPYPCHGCGRFLTSEQMHAASVHGDNWRCEECQ